MSSGNVKKFMFVNRKAPYGTIYALESLEVVLITAAFDQDVSLAFLDDGVYQLKKGQQTKGIEIKNVGSPALYRHWDTSSQDGVPNYVRAQVTAHMHCTGFREWDVAASIGGRPPHVWTVAYDSELAELLIAGAVKFWQLVKNGTPPPLDATPATRAYLLSKYPANRERAMREAGKRAEDLAAIRVDAARQYAEAKTVMDRTTNELLALVGDADGIEGIGWKMTWKLDKGGARRQRFTDQGED